MRKTMLTVAGALLLMVTGVKAEERVNNDLLTVPTAIASLDINSFCKAIMKGDIETVRRLISIGEDVNRKSFGKTPAIYAARYNKVEILEILIDNGANLKIKCDKGYTAQKHAQLSKASEALAVIDRALAEAKAKRKRK